MTTESHKRENPPYWYPDLRALVAVSMLSIFGGVTAMLLFRPMPMTEQAGAVLLTIVGMIIGKVGTIVDYYFGSNKESKDQATTIATMVAAPAVAAAAAAAASTEVASGEVAAWEVAARAGTPEAYRAYLAKYPAGPHAAEAVRLGGV